MVFCPLFWIKVHFFTLSTKFSTGRWVKDVEKPVLPVESVENSKKEVEKLDRRV